MPIDEILANETPEKQGANGSRQKGRIRRLIESVKDPYTGVQILGGSIEWSAKMGVGRYLLDGPNDGFWDNLGEQALLLGIGWGVFEVITTIGHNLLHRRRYETNRGFWPRRIKLQTKHYQVKLPLTAMSIGITAVIETLGVPRAIAQNVGGKPSAFIQTLYTTQVNRRLQDLNHIEKPYSRI